MIRIQFGGEYDEAIKGLAGYDVGGALSEVYGLYGELPAHKINLTKKAITLPSICTLDGVTLAGPSAVHPTCVIKTPVNSSTDNKTDLYQSQLYLSNEGAFFQDLLAFDSDVTAHLKKRGVVLVRRRDMLESVHLLALQQHLTNARTSKYLEYVVIPSNDHIAQYCAGAMAALDDNVHLSAKEKTGSQ